MAQELSRRGKKVVVCEAGKYNQWFGSTFSLLGMLAGKGLTFSKERLWVARGKTAGGASVVFCATAFKPPSWWKEAYGIDLQEEVEELYKEVPIQPLPDSLIGPAARRIMEAAQEIGLDWKPLDKWIRPEKCKPNCGKCVLGCKEGAKWTAREFIEEARQNGAELLLQTKVDRVLTESGRAVGVRAEDPGGAIDIRAGLVVLSAGGQGTPPILQRSGIYDAGQGFFVDPLLLVIGPASGQGSRYDVPMTAGANMEQDGIVMTDLLFPTTMFCMGLAAYSGVKGWAYLPKTVHANRTLGVMVKVRDELDGRVNADESFSKAIDHKIWWRLNKGKVLAEEILMKAGVKRKDLMTTNVSGAHPGGTVRIGELLDNNCQTEIKNCYCMDTSIIPDAWGLPPTVTIVAMAKRVARRITAEVEASVAIKEGEAVQDR